MKKPNIFVNDSNFLVHILLLTSGFIFGFFAYTSQVEALTQQEFVQHYLATSSRAKLAKANLDRARGEHEADSSLNRTTLGISPYYKKEVTTYSGSTLEEELKGLYLEAELEQTTALGLTANLNYTELYDDNKPTQSYTLSLSEPLFRNAFGSADRKTSRAADATLKAAELSYTQDYLGVCGRGHSLYINAWAKTREYDILSETLVLAEKAFRTTRTNFNRKLVKKIDFESAQADFLRLQDETALAKIEMQTAQDTLKKEWPDQKVALAPTPIELSSPLSISEVKVRGRELKLLDLQKAEFTRTASVLEAEAEKSRSQPMVNLTATLGQNKSTNPALAPLDESTEDWYRVGLATEWPVWDGSKSGTKRAAEAKKYAAELQLHSLTKSVPLQVSELQEQVVSIQDAVGRHKERLKLRQSQIREAARLLNLGKIEFEDYIRFRDLELRERLQGAKLENDGWATLIKLASATGDGFGVCR